MEFDVLVFFLKILSGKYKFNLSLTRITALYMQTDIHDVTYLAQFFVK